MPSIEVQSVEVSLTPVEAQTFDVTVSAPNPVIQVVGEGPQGPGVPRGGAVNDLLYKSGTSDFDTDWTDIPTVDGVQFDVAADEGEPATGELVWNAEEGTVDLGLNGVNNTFLHVGQESVYRVSNRTGSTIAKGRVCGFAGTIGGSGRLKVKLFDASSDPAKTIMGVAAEAIPNDADGYVVAFGKVRKVKTDYPGWAEEDILYADPASPGGLTPTRPSAPDAIVTVAALVTRAANTGELFVRPTFAPQLAETQDVLLSSPADGQVLTYDSAQGLWVNEAVPTDSVISVNGQQGTVVLDATDVGAYADTNPSAFVDAAGAAAAAPVQSVNGAQGTVVLTTSDVAEGTALYFTDGRASAAAPVQSVNSLVGTVVLDAAAVGAYADTNPSNFIDASGAPVQSVNGSVGTVVLDAAAVGAVGTATGLWVYDYGTAVPSVRPVAAAVYWRGTAEPGTAIAVAGDIWFNTGV